MEITIGASTGAITQVVQYLVSPFMDHVNYLLHYKTNANDLRKQMASLGEQKTAVQHSVDDARMRGEVIRVVVEGWLTRVNQVESEETTLHNELEERKGCLQRGCLLRYHVGKNAKRMIDEVKELINEGRSFAVVANPPPLPPGLESMQTLDFHVYDSTKLAMDKIMEALKDEGVWMVGVYGIGGVGKTTLMKEAAKKMKKDGLFDQVVMVTVSQEPVLKKIQGEIAENLGLKLSEESLDVRARRLLERLKKEKRILIVLDDLWKPLNLLEELGIPCDSNCKVVLTTRRLQVCRNMGTQLNVELKVLSEGDAWALFKWAAGDGLENDNTLREVANQVVRECGGLPLTIVTIGKALRAKDINVWKDVARKLEESSSSTLGIKGVYEKVFRSIKLSYDSLDNDPTRFCFLLCCMFPKDFPISEDDLLPYVVGERVFENIHTLQEARYWLQLQMERLTASCLLLDDSERRKVHCVRMHNVIRKVSIWIATKEGHDFVVKSGRRLTHFPEEDRDKKCKRLSLMQNEITKLPIRLQYWFDQLMTLSLRDNKDLRGIPDGFFQGMISLKTLDLVNTNISWMPSSLSCLTNLRVFRISDDHYPKKLVHEPFNVSLVGKLKKLEMLQVRNMNVLRLPEVIGELTNLKSLDLSTNESMSITPNILSKLSLLEELNLERSFHEWEIEEEEGSKKEKDRGTSKEKCCSLSEVASLSSLSRLRIKVSDIKCLGANGIPFRCWENLSHFSIIFGKFDWSSMSDDVKACATVVVICGAVIHKNPLLLLERTEGLQMNACGGDILSLGAKVLNNLRVLCVEECENMEYLLRSSSTTTVSQITFSGLEELHLYSLHKLKAIIMCNHGSLPSGCFNNLRFLDLYQCHGLITIIPSDLLAKLPNLEDLKVRSCRGATEVLDSKGLQLLAGEEGQAEATILPKLKLLNLDGLPSLRTIWDEGVVSHLSILNLEVIFLRQLDKLTFMFSLATAQRLQQLKQLQIVDCKEMVEIISLIVEEGDAAADDDEINTKQQKRSSLLARQLNDNPPSSSSSSLVLPPCTPIFGNLRRLRIKGCHSLKHILPMSLAQLEELCIQPMSLAQLEELDISDCSNMKEIIFVNDDHHHHDHDIGHEIEEKTKSTVLFPRLKDLQLVNLPNLLMVSKGMSLLYSHDDYNYWPSLEYLKVMGCPQLERFPITAPKHTTTKLRKFVVEEEWFNNVLKGDNNKDDKLHLIQKVQVTVRKRNSVSPSAEDEDEDEDEDGDRDEDEDEDGDRDED